MKPVHSILTPGMVGLLAVRFAVGCFAGEPTAPMAKGIQDNSFLIEEAYNQEAGVVQHIFNLRRSIQRLSGADEHGWDLVLTEEFPVFSQAHQFSYTLPYSFVSGGGAPSANGLGDMLLNYRFQALMETDTKPAFAPRLSLILPTGDAEKGLGNDTVGYQINLPLSKIVQDRVTLHANAGVTFLPDVQGRNPVSYNLGGSVIYAATPRFNWMLELLGEWKETVSDRRIERDFEAVISPGFRYAFNLAAGQLVVGLGVPLGLTRAAPDYGAFLYVSFEHQLWKQ